MSSSSDEPGAGQWANPSQPATPTPVAPPPAPDGWGAPPQAPYGWGQFAPQAPRPGIIPLRPLGVGELLDGAFTTIRRYPGATLGLAAAVMLVVESLQILTQYLLLHGVSDTTTFNSDGVNSTSGDVLALTSTADIVLFVVTLVATALLSGMLAAVIGKAALGRPMSAGEAWGQARPVFWRLLGATGLVFVIQIGVVVVAILPGIVVLLVGSAAGAAVLLIIGGIAAVVAVVWLEIALLFTTPVVMLEKQGIRTAMKRSRTLVTGSWWRVFGILALATIIAQTISGIIVVPFALAGGIGSIFSGNVDSQFQFHNLVITGIGGFLAGTLVRPFSSGIVALLYLDRRMRSEGLDLTLQQAAANPAG